MNLYYRENGNKEAQRVKSLELTCELEKKDGSEDQKKRKPDLFDRTKSMVYYVLIFLGVSLAVLGTLFLIATIELARNTGWDFTLSIIALFLMTAGAFLFAFHCFRAIAAVSREQNPTMLFGFSSVLIAIIALLATLIFAFWKVGPGN